MPYKRKKPFLVRHQATFINVLTVLVFGLICFAAIVLIPDAVEQLQTMKGMIQ